MNVLTKFIYWLCLIGIFAVSILSFLFLGWQIGLAVLIALPAFIIAYSLSEKFAISRRDKYRNSEWGIFCKKICWAWSSALIIYAIAYIAIGYNFGDPLGIMPK